MDFKFAQSLVQDSFTVIPTIMPTEPMLLKFFQYWFNILLPFLGIPIVIHYKNSFLNQFRGEIFKFQVL
jgi:hypothetical protein